MKGCPILRSRYCWLVLIAWALINLPGGARAESRIWSGSPGGDGCWTNADNWGGTAPLNNDSLFFAGTNGLSNTNNFGVTNTYNGITFSSGAGSFLLNGNPIALNNGITNNSLHTQTNNLDMQVGDFVVDVTNGGVLILNGSLQSVSGTLTKVGLGTVLLNGDNSYPGGTLIRAGTIHIRDSDRLGAAGGSLILEDGSLEAENFVTLNNRAVILNAGDGIFNVDQLSILTVTNEIAGPGNLVKTGYGLLDLACPVTATGTMDIEAGTLYVDGTVTGPSAVTVYSGAVLGGGGTVAPDVIINDGGTLSPGTNDSEGPRTLTLSNLVLNPNSIVRMDLNVPGVVGGTNDLIIVHGNLTLDGILKVTGSGTNGTYPIIQYDGMLINHGMILGSSVNGTLIVDTSNKVISINATSFPLSPPAPMRILFIGNSLTYTYDIPGTLQSLAYFGRDWLTYGSRLVGGSMLAEHDATPGDINLIDSGNYDIVMLQEYSSRPSIPADRDSLMFPAARDLNSHILSHGERTMFYETWGYPYGDYMHCALYDTPPQYAGCSSKAMTVAVRMGYARIANELNAAISPVGLAWLTVQAERPDINLYIDTQDYHPGPAGSYLAACVHYASILGRSPVGNYAMGYLTNSSVAAYLQSVAERTVFQDPWAYDQYGFAQNRYYWAFRWTDYTNQTDSRLSGTVISGTGGLPSPSVKLDTDVGQTNNVYLGVYGFNYEQAGQGRLFIRPGGSLVVTGSVMVGKEGQGWVQHDGGRLEVDGVLTIAEQPFSMGSYTLTNGTLQASQIQRGQGWSAFNVTGGQLSFGQFGSSRKSFNLTQAGGTLTASSNKACIYGNYSLGAGANLDLALGVTNPLLSVSGTMTLAGTLTVTSPPGYVPAVGQQFTLVTARSIFGRFGSVKGSGLLPGNMALAVSCTQTSVVAAVVDALADSNTNGLPDWWELQYFGSTSSGQTWVSCFLEDGVPNGVKYALYADPTVPVPLAMFPRASVSNGHLTTTYREHTGGTGTVGIDYCADGITYLVFVTDDLTSGSWLSGTNWVEPTGDRVDNGDGTESVTVRVIAPMDASPQKFMRLGIGH